MCNCLAAVACHWYLEDEKIIVVVQSSLGQNSLKISHFFSVGFEKLLLLPQLPAFTVQASLRVRHDLEAKEKLQQSH